MIRLCKTSSVILDLAYSILLNSLETAAHSNLHVSVASLNPLPDMPIIGSSNSAEKRDMMSNILTNADTIFRLSRKHCGKRRNCLL